MTVGYEHGGGLSSGLASFGAVEGHNYVLQPEHAAVNNGTANQGIGVNFAGAWYRAARNTVFNRIACRASVVAVPGSTLALAVYQAPDGLVGPSTVVNLIQTYTAVINAVGIVEMTGDCALSVGLYAVLVGTTGGAADFSLTCYSSTNFNLLTLNAAPTYRPTIFTAAGAATATPPATKDFAGWSDAGALNFAVALRGRVV